MQGARSIFIYLKIAVPASNVRAPFIVIKKVSTHVRTRT